MPLGSDEAGPEAGVGECEYGRPAAPVAVVNVAVPETGEKKTQRKGLSSRDVALVAGLSMRRVYAADDDEQKQGHDGVSHASEEVQRTRAMKFELNHGHEWDVSTREAIDIQNRLASSVVEVALPSEPATIAGVDVSFRRRAYKDYAAQCGIAVLSLPDLEIVDEAQWEGDVTFPYVPGLLSFREIPAVIAALERLSVRPDIFMTDGQGLAHPRRFGLACHLGVALDMPAIGVAKKKLVGEFSGLSLERGSHEPLTHSGELVGAAVRTRTATKPVFVSIGHRITLLEAIRLTLVCAPRFKIPEPTRMAHRLSRE